METVYYEKPAKLAQVPGTGHVVIEASAGTGKTHTLEHLVVDLILDGGVDVAELLVVTFTEAATRELRERIRGLLRKLCDLTEPTKRPKGPGVEARHWIIDEDARRRLREALFRFDGATIATIHGFCQRVLTEHAFASGRLFEQAHVDGAESFGIAFREVLREALAEEGPILDALEARLAFDADFEKLEKILYDCHRTRSERTPRWDPEGLEVAIARIPAIADLQAQAKALLKGQGNAPTQIPKFLGALEAEVLSVTDEDPGRPAFVAAFLAWCAKGRSVETIRRPCGAHLRHYLHPLRAEAPVFGALLDALEAIEARAAGPEVMLVDALLPRVRARLEDRKRALGQIDYDDMLLGVHEAVGADPARRGSGEGDGLVRVLRQRWRYALVDEFQDTDEVQWQIFDRIFVDGAGENRLFVIGDPKQAIYGFRGADVHAYLKAKAALLEPANAEPVSLDQNFRSSEAMIAVVNRILERDFFTGDITYAHPVRCGRPNPSWDAGEADHAPVHLVHLYGEGQKLASATARGGLAHFIAGEIGRLVHPKDGLVVVGSDGERRPLRHEEIYILTFAGWEGRAVGDVLRRFGVPHAFYKQEGLYQTPEAEDVCRLLRAIDRPGDRSARLKAWLTPLFEVPLAHLDRWRDVSEHHVLVERLLRWKQMAEGLQWARLFDDVVARSGLVRRLVFSQQSERALTNYLHLFEALLEETHRRPTTLADLVAELQARIDGRSELGADGNVQRLETERSAVQILTMHKAKGLQAKVVFIAGGFGSRNGGGGTAVYHDAMGRRRLHLGKAPESIDARIAAERQHENERLLYVALTRAEVRMYLPYFGGPLDEAEDDGRVFGWPQVGGCYRHLQGRLASVLAADDSGLSVRAASCARRSPAPADAARIAGWTPDPALLEAAPSLGGRTAALSARHRGVLLTSYTRMSKDVAWQPPSADFHDERGDERGVSTGDEAAEPAPETGLPGGREVGIFLHEVLERTPPREVLEADAAAWARGAEVRRRAEEAARRNGIGLGHLDEALALVHRALRSPIQARDAGGEAVVAMPGGVASGTRHVAEMAFAFPIPEAHHPAPDEAPGVDGLPFAVRRGYVQGLVDLVFEHEDRIYLLDWKSDRLPSYAPSAIEAHVARNYTLQAQVYALAVHRLLATKGPEDHARRFGGILYAFLRGMGDGAGIWFSRPDGSTVDAWVRALEARRAWGGPVIEEATHGV
jgi:exodeoxyribonuclease V beta subunit